LLGINTVAELARREPEALYRELSRKMRSRQDICVLDTFRAAAEQVRDPSLPPEKCVWWYWSRVREASATSSRVKEMNNAKLNFLSPCDQRVIWQLVRRGVAQLG
jgi:hypothetical protein